MKKIIPDILRDYFVSAKEFSAVWPTPFWDPAGNHYSNTIIHQSFENHKQFAIMARCSLSRLLWIFQPR